MAVFLLCSTFHNNLYLPHFFQPSQKKNLLFLSFTKDIPTLYEERRISEQSVKYNPLIIISKPEKYTTSG